MCGRANPDHLAASVHVARGNDALPMTHIRYGVDTPSQWSPTTGNGPESGRYITAGSNASPFTPGGGDY